MPARKIITAADLTTLTSPELASLLLDASTASNVAVIDVRDSDHIGGHIKGSSWVPTSELEARIPELIRLNQDKDKVVFHCMLSQQRGPSSALKFMRALQAAAGDAHNVDSSTGGSSSSSDYRSGKGPPDNGDKSGGGGHGGRNALTGEVQHHQQSQTVAPVTQHRPQVYILEGGFGMWASRYGDDPRLTEAFVKDFWE